MKPLGLLSPEKASDAGRTQANRVALNASTLEEDVDAHLAGHWSRLGMQKLTCMD